MEILQFKSEYFNLKDTLECGQIFRYKPINGYFLVFSGEKVCRAYQDGEVVTIESEDIEYFKNFFDLQTAYEKINCFALSSSYDIVKKSAQLGKGIRILNQQKEEMLFSFIISQNNMIPRIRAIIERTCVALGKKLTFNGEEYFAFPSAKILATKDEQFFKDLGYGYRAKFMVEVANAVVNGQANLEEFAKLQTKDLKKQLIALKGVGEKVADCVALFGFRRTDSFPVDTWIEKVYLENFNGKEKNRDKIAEWLVKKFGNNSGYFQQYLFHYKRNLENSR